MCSKLKYRELGWISGIVCPEHLVCVSVILPVLPHLPTGPSSL